MKKFIFIVLSSLVLLGGCQKAPTNQTSPVETPETHEATSGEMPDVSTEVNLDAIKELSILAPGGAPALSLIPLFENGNQIDIVDGPDVIQAELTGASNYDLIVAPTNLGVKLASLGKSEYRLLDVLTWGNLYFVGTSKEALGSGKIAAFGEQAVTGLVYKQLYPDYLAQTIWYPSVSEAQAALLTGEVEVAMIAEPAATATIAKAKENGKELVMIQDLQELWGDGGYPQAGIFVKESTFKEKESAILDLEAYLFEFVEEANSDPSIVVDKIDSIGAEKLSVPSSAIVSKTWNRLNLAPTRASDVTEGLRKFLELFEVNAIEGTFIE